MPGAILYGDFAGICRGGAGDNFAMTVNGNGPDVGRTTVENQNNILFHNNS
jgi:hypothetical protein